jgi:hypothetical protein
MFTPIFLIGVHIVHEVLVQHPIDLLYLAISLLVECCAKRQFHPHLLKQMFPKALRKLGVSSIDNGLRHSMVLNPHVKKQFC